MKKAAGFQYPAVVGIDIGKAKFRLVGFDRSGWPFRDVDVKEGDVKEGDEVAFEPLPPGVTLSSEVEGTDEVLNASGTGSTAALR